MGLGTLVGKVGIGLAAGLAGTAAITVIQAIGKRLNPSEATDMLPAKAVETLFELRPADAEAEQRLATLAHWGYGTIWGVFRGLLDAVGLRGTKASALHTAAVQAAAMVMLPGLKLTPPVRQWGAKMTGLETLLHAAYAGVAGWVYDRLSLDLERRRRGRLQRFAERLVG